MIKHNVPFYPNTLDDTHCFQAAIRSVLKYFLPDKEYTWVELEIMTAKKEDLWTWPTQGLITLHRLGFEIIDMSGFDVETFIETGEDYLLSEYGKEFANEQIKHSDIDQERLFYRESIPNIKYQKTLPTIEDLKALLEKGYLIICNVNSKALNNQLGYVGHFVVLIGYDKDHLYLHDPGLPPLENRKVLYAEFKKAWAYPNEKAKNLTGLKYSIKI